MISIYGIFDKQFFTLFDDKEIDEYQIISKLCRPIVNAGIENKNFEKRVVDREKVSSTSYLNIAVPHCFEATSNKTIISIGLLKYPVKWGINTVNIVFLLSISRKDQKSFIKILERLIKIFTSEAWNKQYKRIDSYDKLMNFICENESWLNLERRDVPMEKKSFIYSIPTKVYFGQMYQHIGEVIGKYGHKALFLYDGDYIKTNGLYQKIRRFGRWVVV